MRKEYDFRHSLIESAQVKGNDLTIVILLLKWHGQQATYEEKITLVMKGCDDPAALRRVLELLKPIEVANVSIDTGRIITVEMPLERQDGLIKIRCKAINFIEISC